MKFRIWTILWVFALLASAMATFGGGGIFLSLAVAGLWTLFFAEERIKPLGCLVVLSLAVVLMILLLPVVQVAREAARRAQCMNNMKQLSLALLNFESAQGRFPRAAESLPNSKHRHSWRMWISPYVESSSFYDQYKKGEPWDGSNNTKLVSQTRLDYLYHCPSHHSAGKQSHYFAIVGEHTAWPPDRGCTIREITDGTANTVMLIEAPHKSVPWAKPEDLRFDEAVELLSSQPQGENFGHEVYEGFFYKSSRGLHVAFVDGWVQLLRLPISKAHAVALLTIDGGEAIDPRQIPRLSNPELDFRRIYSLSVFVLLSLLPVLKIGRNPDSARLVADEVIADS